VAAVRGGRPRGVHRRGDDDEGEAEHRDQLEVRLEPVDG
jgi:hypothetical protein